MSEFRQQKSRDSDELEETFVYGPIPRRPQPRPRAAYRPRSYASDTIPFVDAEVTITRGDSLDRRRLPKYNIPPPPPPPPPRTSLETEDSTSLNNILDALHDLDDSDSDRRSSRATTGSTEESEDELDVLTALPDKWSAVSMRSDNSARVQPNIPEENRLQPSRPEDNRLQPKRPDHFPEDLIIAAPLPALKPQVCFIVFYTLQSQFA